MRSRIRGSIMTAVSVGMLCLGLSDNGRAAAQNDDEGWKPCPRCQNNADRTAAWERNNIDGVTDYDPHDLSGIWGYDGVSGAFDEAGAPPFTPYGQQLYEQTLGVADETGRFRFEEGSEKDYSLLNCDPLGYPRLYTYNYGFEFVMLPDRVLQFFEWGHTWRTIWTDGRKLRDYPPQLQWLGWSIGYWDGDTFVIESNGYDDRSWIERTTARNGQSGGGFPHSEDMRVMERYTRVNYGTLEAELTVYDPKVYTAAWVTPKTEIKLVPDTELWEYFCVPTESNAFNEEFGVD